MILANTEGKNTTLMMRHAHRLVIITNLASIFMLGYYWITGRQCSKQVPVAPYEIASAI